MYRGLILQQITEKKLLVLKDWKLSLILNELHKFCLGWLYISKSSTNIFLYQIIKLWQCILHLQFKICLDAKIKVIWIKSIGIITDETLVLFMLRYIFLLGPFNNKWANSKTSLDSVRINFNKSWYIFLVLIQIYHSEISLQKE